MQAKKAVKIKKEGGRVEVIAKYFLLTMLLSFLGWAFEVGIIFLQTRRFYNTGLLTMPACPIYGVSLITTYFLLGTPQKGRGILKNVTNPLPRCLLYVTLAFLIPTFAELVVGFFFDRFYHAWLWSYHAIPLNFKGYICFPVSVGWAMAIFLFMGLVFERLKALVFKLPKALAIVSALLLASVTVFDFISSMVAL